ncbi:hypothetical protein K492DRAFT_189688 [Lichtheimia hyalospora FSU 10163]|nr:hypothetical protein K492DRAFT_189688 [Lichtheimia hyalospora FSU 10163]
MQFNNQHDYTNLMSTTFGTTNGYFYQQEPAATTTSAPTAPLLLEPYDHMVPSTDVAVVNNTKNNDRDQTSAKDNNRKRPKRKQVKNACVNCQKACKKCDDGRPCQRCIKLGLTATCTNSPRKERKKGVKRGPYKKRQTAQQQQEEQGVIGASTFNTNNDMYQQQPINITPPLTTNTSPLSSSPLSADLGYNYLAATHDVASSASASSLSPVSPHFPQLAWENPRQYDGLWQDTSAIDNTNVMVQHMDAPITTNNTMTTTGFDSVAYNNMVKSQQQQPFDFLYMEDPCIMTSDDNTWAMYSQQQQQQQQQMQYYQQPQSTGYWQTFLANA